MSNQNPDAYSDTGEGVNETTQTPDQVAATGLRGGGGGIVDLLRQLGPAGPPPPPPGMPPGPPPDLMGSGIPPSQIMGLMAPPSQMGVFGAALSGGVSAMRGQPDPAQAILQAAQKQQNEVAQMMEKLQAQQDLNKYRGTLITDRARQFRLEQDKFKDLQLERETKKNELAITTLRGVLDNPNTPPALLPMLGEQYAAAMQKTFGVTIPANIVLRTMKPEEQDRVLAEIHDGLPLDLILKNHPAMTPQDLQSYVEIKDNESVLKRLGLMSPQDREKKVLELRKLNAETLEAEHPELKLDPKIGAAVLMKAQSTFPGRTYYDLSKDERARTYALTALEQRQQRLEEHRQQAYASAMATSQAHLAAMPQELKLRNAAAMDLDTMKKNAMSVADSKDFYVDKAGNLAPFELTVPEAKKAGFNRLSLKEYQTLTDVQQSMLILQNLKDTVTEMEKEHLFVTKSGIPGKVEEAWIWGKRTMGDPEVSKRLLANMNTQKGHMVVLMRNIGEKGVKAIAGMAPAMEAMDPSLGAPAIKAFLGQIESEIRIIGTHSKTPEAFSSVPLIFPKRTGKDLPGSTLVAPPRPGEVTAEEVPISR